MIRGINQQNIFADDEDHEKFMAILDTYHKKMGYEIYAYCLMGNHVHLLIKEGKEILSNTMKRIGASYAYWYNWQYNRKGHLFQDRYKSEAVEDDAYFLTVLRYIHQNPLKAGLTDNVDSYKWSSYKEYTSKTKRVNVDFTLSLFAKEKDKAIEKFKRFNYESNNDQCLEVTEKRKTLSDKKIRQLVLKKFDIDVASFHNVPSQTQIEVLRYLKKLNGSSLRQLSRLTGLTVNKIFRA